MFRKIAFLFLVLQFTACAELQNAAGTLLNQPLTTAEVAGGLKEALNIGISKGADRLSATDGYFKSAYKILLPEEVRKVTERLKVLPGFDKLENEMLRLINRGAEDAAKKAKPIFVSAIKQMTFQDAMSILMGDKNAATNYLNGATYSQLYGAFKPEIVNSLDKVKATELWDKAITKYNKIPFITKVNPDLGDYVTNQALTGLFGMVEKEELSIRTNISSRTSDLLKKVFAKQDS